MNVKNKVVMAYEPIWAIGTGVTATSEQAEDMCKYIRNVISETYSETAEIGVNSLVTKFEFCKMEICHY